MRERNRVRVAAIQAAPVLMDPDASVEKAQRLILEAAEGGAELIVFPEAFLSGYPRGLRFGTSVGNRTPEGRKDFARYLRSAIRVPSRHIDKLSDTIRQVQAYVVMGVVELDDRGEGTLFGTILYFGPNGELLARHRKLKPTAAERLIWGEGDGSTLAVVDTPFGRLGGLICWENYMPLARAAMYEKGVQIFVTPTADNRDTWQATLRHIACEGRCFVISTNQYVTKEMYPQDLYGKDDLDEFPDEISRGGTAIVDPFGQYIEGPLYSREGILYADLDLGLLDEAHYEFDPVGHYSRPDVFKLLVNETPQR